MDEAFKKIEKILTEQQQPSQIDFLLPKKTPAAKPGEDSIDIAHYGKASTGEPAKDSDREKQMVEPQHSNPSAKIGVGSHEFNLDELSSEAMGDKVSQEVASKIGTGGRVLKLDDLGENSGGYDPLMGNVFKPSNNREITLDELSSDSEQK